MEPHHVVWSTIIGYMILAISISIVTSMWIRYHLKRNDLKPRRALKKRYLTLKKKRRAKRNQKNIKNIKKSEKHA